MKTVNVAVTLEKAKEWYNSGNAALKEVALQAFNKDELEYNFKKITTLGKACDALGLNHRDITNRIKCISEISKASAAMFKLNIIRRALNLGQDFHLTKNPKNDSIWYPYNPFITTESLCYRDAIKSGDMEVIGKIKSEGTIYYVLGGGAYHGSYDGLGGFFFHLSMGYATASVGFLGCANKEIAQHFGKYFGMLITEAKYGDMIDFEIIE